MKWKDDKPREYYSKYEKVNVSNGQGWFDVYKLPGNLYGICEPNQYQEVNIFLVPGTERALLFDTGMGIRKIRPLVEELYTGEIVVVNSHFHFDHIANNYCFDNVHIYNDPLAIKVAQNGLPKEALGNQLEERMFRFGYPEGFSPENYHIPPYNAIPIEEGHCFDLGDRCLRVIHTPGHSNDAIMLYDEKNKILLTGDTFYPGALYAHFENEEFGHFSLDDYINSMERVSELIPKLDYLCCSHRDFTAPPIKLKEAAEGLRKIAEGKPLVEKEVDDGHTYLEEGSELKEAVFDGFSIIYKKKSVKK
ncbi:MAG: MBL fold metallo-hydrolase [Anaerovoracaceae bacterium]